VNKLKTWTNLVLGWVYDLNRDVPDDDKLRAARTGLGPRADAGGSGRHDDGRRRPGRRHLSGSRRARPAGETWQLDARFIAGATDVKMQGAWADLDAYSKRGVTYPGGKVLPIDMKRSTPVITPTPRRRSALGDRTAWRSSAAMAGPGRSWAAAKRSASPSRASGGPASKRADDRAYHRRHLHAKATWYGFLRSTIAYAKAIVEEGHGHAKPVGLCHFSRDTTDEWFEMATAEAVVAKIVNGYPKRVWQPMPGRENHYLDCRVYNMAAPKSCCWTR
jgi:hypothetical protein